MTVLTPYLWGPGGTPIKSGGAVLTPTEPESGLLRWAPPDTTGYTVVTPGATGTVNLTAGVDYVLNCTTVRSRVLQVNNGRNVVIIGGEVNIATDGGSNNSNMGIRLQDQTGIVFIEGWRMRGSFLTEGFQMNCEDADVYIQNVYIDDLFGAQDRNHSDLIQPWGGVKSLRVSRFTGFSRYQGFVFKEDFAAVSNPYVYMEKCSTVLQEGDPASSAFPNNGGRYYMFNSAGNPVVVEFDSGTVWVDTNSQYLGGEIKINPNHDGEKVDAIGTYVDLSSSDAGWIGRLYKGVPPGGHYVAPGDVGMSYVSPGYMP